MGVWPRFGPRLSSARSILVAASTAVLWGLGACASDAASADLSREATDPLPTTTVATTTTTTSTTTTTTTIAPALDRDGVARSLVTTTDVVVPVLDVLGDSEWLVRTPCQELAVVTAGEVVDRVHVVLDPGHGGSETGAVTSAGLVEAEVNFAVATVAAEQLEAVGFDVLLTRYRDIRVPIVTRAEIADILDVPLLVSIHHQGLEPVPLQDEPGTEVFYQLDSEESRRFAGLLHEEALIELGKFDIEWFAGVDAGATYRLNADTGGDFYGMVRRPRVPAVLAEMSFLGNEAEEQLLNTEAFIEAEARAISNAIVRWFSTDDPGSGFVEPSFELRSDAGTGGLGGCTDPDLGETAELPADLDPADYPTP